MTRVLLVEDSVVNRKVMRHKLEDIPGTRVREAGSGADALTLLEGESFDLMISDIHMPGVSGVDLIREVRRQEETMGTHLPIVVVSGSADSSDAQRAVGAGADLLLPKPFETADLQAAMATLVPGPSAGPERPEGPEAPTRTGDMGALTRRQVR